MYVGGCTFQCIGVPSKRDRHSRCKTNYNGFLHIVVFITWNHVYYVLVLVSVVVYNLDIQIALKFMCGGWGEGVETM